MNTASTAARGKLETFTRKSYAGILVVLTLELWSKQAAQWEHFSVLADAIMVLVWISRVGNKCDRLDGAREQRHAYDPRLQWPLICLAAACDDFRYISLPLITTSRGSGGTWASAAVSMALRCGLRVSFLSYLAVLLTAWTAVRTLEIRWGARALGEALQGLRFCCSSCDRRRRCGDRLCATGLTRSILHTTRLSFQRP